MDHDERSDILRRHAAMLSEHFDSVEIVACKTNDDGNGVARFQWGLGSWFERYGLVRSWVVRAEAQMQDEHRIDSEDEES